MVVGEEVWGVWEGLPEVVYKIARPGGVEVEVGEVVVVVVVVEGVVATLAHTKIASRTMMTWPPTLRQVTTSHFEGVVVVGVVEVVWE